MAHDDPTNPAYPADELLDRYLAGRVTSEERAWMERYLADHPLDAGLVDAFAARAHERFDHNVLLDARRRIARRLEGYPGAIGAVRVPVGRRGADRWWTRSGLAVALVVAIAVAVVGTFHTTRPSRVPELTPQTYTTAAGQRATVVLRDGTRAMLGPATTLAVTTHPSDGSIAVTMTGQAEFTVAHRAAAPFTVRAGDALVRVLGTTFMVRHYEREPHARVIVTEGRVALQSVSRGSSAASTPHGRVVLVAGMMGTADSSAARVVPNIAVEDYTAWTRGQLVFRQTSVRDIVAELNRVYGADLRVTDSVLSARALTWTVSSSQLTLDEVLDALTGVLSAHLIRTGDTLTLAPGPSPSRKAGGSRSRLTLEHHYGR